MTSVEAQAFSAPVTDFPSSLVAGYFGIDNDPVVDANYGPAGLGVANIALAATPTGALGVSLVIPNVVTAAVSIDWGDGTAVETPITTPQAAKAHTYAKPGGYTITVYNAQAVGKCNARAVV
jgi:PKD repeat protein